MNTGAIVTAPKLLTQYVRRAMNLPPLWVLVCTWERWQGVSRRPTGFKHIVDMRLQ